MNRQNRFTTTLFGTLMGLLVLGLSDTARGQMISVDRSEVDFTAPIGGASHQTVNVSSDQSTTVSINVNNAPSWLTVSPTGPVNVLVGMPTPVTVTANAVGLSLGTYSFVFTVGVQGSLAAPIPVTVKLTVSGTSLLSANPSSLSFAAQVGTLGSSIPTQTIAISSSGPALSYTVSATTLDGHSWLIPFTTTGTTGGSPITVGVNPAGLVANTYQGMILATSTTTPDSVAIGVTLTVTPNATLSVTPATVQPFLFQIGGALPAAQTLMVSSSPSSVNFTVTMSPQVSWLVINPTSAATGINGQPVAVLLSVNTAGLQPGSYSTAITVGAVGGSSLPPIPVQLVVSNNPILKLSTNVLNFTAQFGSTPGPADQAVQITTVGTGSSVPFTFTSDSGWLTATASGRTMATGTTPATLTVHVNIAGLLVNNYTGTITVRPTTGDQYSLALTVNLAVGTAATLTAGPAQLLYSFQTNQPPPPAQLVQVQSTGQPLTFTVATAVTSAANCPATNWLGATSNSAVTPAIVTVSLTTTAGMTAGVCSGTVTLSYDSGAGPATLAIPVTVDISTTAELAIGLPLGFGVFTAAQGGPTIGQAISLSSTDPATPVSFSATSGSTGPSPWLFVASSGLTTPQSLAVQIVPGSLLPGTYTGTISINSTSLPSSPVVIPVTLTITGNITVTVTPPGPLTFNQAQGGSVPPPQTLTLTSSAAGATFTASTPSTANCSWLQVQPTSGPATGAITLSVLPNTLPANSAGYACPVTLAFQGSSTAPVTITAILIVGPAQTVTVSPTSLAFTYQQFGTVPASQKITVSSTSGPVQFSVATTSSGWLSVDAISGVTPKDINVSVNPQNVAVGTTVTGTVTISSPGVLAAPIAVPVTLTVTAVPLPLPTVISNSASSIPGGIAPGELITIKGTLLAPANPPGGASFKVNAQGGVDSILNGVQVLFDGTPGTPTFVSPTQINVIVPYEIAGRTTTNIVVSNQGAQALAIQQSVTAVTPAIYTLNATGQGQGAIVNLTDGAINGPPGGVPVTGGLINTTPAAQGSYLAVFATGGGQTNPRSTTGSVSPLTTLLPLAGWTLTSGTVTATIGGQPAPVLFAGAAPGDVTGVIQFNLQVPANVVGNALPIVITVNGVSTPLGVTVAVKSSTGG